MHEGCRAINNALVVLTRIWLMFLSFLLCQDTRSRVDSALPLLHTTISDCQLINPLCPLQHPKRRPIGRCSGRKWGLLDKIACMCAYSVRARSDLSFITKKVCQKVKASTTIQRGPYESNAGTQKPHALEIQTLEAAKPSSLTLRKPQYILNGQTSGE